MPEMVVDDKAAGEISRRAAGMAGPDRHRPIKAEIEHDAAEIEQEHVGGAGEEGWLGHGEAGVTKIAAAMQRRGLAAAVRPTIGGVLGMLAIR